MWGRALQTNVNIIVTFLKFKQYFILKYYLQNYFLNSLSNLSVEFHGITSPDKEQCVYKFYVRQNVENLWPLIFASHYYTIIFPSID